MTAPPDLDPAVTAQAMARRAQQSTQGGSARQVAHELLRSALHAQVAPLAARQTSAEIRLPPEHVRAAGELAHELYGYGVTTYYTDLARTRPSGRLRLAWPAAPLPPGPKGAPPPPPPRTALEPPQGVLEWLRRWLG